MLDRHGRQRHRSTASAATTRSAASPATTSSTAMPAPTSSRAAPATTPIWSTDALDTVVEVAGEGNRDIIYTTVNYTIGGAVEVGGARRGQRRGHRSAPADRQWHRRMKSTAMPAPTCSTAAAAPTCWSVCGGNDIYYHRRRGDPSHRAGGRRHRHRSTPRSATRSAAAPRSRCSRPTATPRPPRSTSPATFSPRP